MKQYIVEDAYTDNYHVITVIDGEIQSDRILAYYELSGYETRLQEEGYKRCYYVDLYGKKYQEALSTLNNAKEMLDYAVANPVNLSKEAIKKIKKILFLEDNND